MLDSENSFISLFEYNDFQIAKMQSIIYPARNNYRLIGIVKKINVLTSSIILVIELPQDKTSISISIDAYSPTYQQVAASIETGFTIEAFGEIKTTNILPSIKAYVISKVVF